LQWLFDIVVELVRVAGIYVHRGNPGAWDFTILDLTVDNAWHDLDLSSIVPANAHSVNLITNISGTQIERNIKLRSKDVTGDHNLITLWTQVSNVKLGGCFPLAVDSNRVIQYKVNHISLDFVNLLVSGWWY